MSASTSIVTFFFTDLEGSTKRWELDRGAMDEAMARHDRILHEAVADFNGFVFRTVGDGLCAGFAAADDAVCAAISAQRELLREDWGSLETFRVRIAIHTGVVEARNGDYVGPALNRVARILAAAHGGQILISEATDALVRDRLPGGIHLADLGVYRLRDLVYAEHIFQASAPGLPADFPPLRVAGARPNNLPALTSDFLGREAQLEAVRRLLDEAGVRLLTLTGPGGIGKTRLALQGAADQLSRFEDGVFFVDLSAVRDPEVAFETIVRTVGVTGTSDERPIALLDRQLRGRRMLLLLDNFEQVMDAADGVADLLQHCPELKVVVTSREALRVKGEHVFPVPPLSLPNGNGARSAELVAGYEAVRLFVERARDVQPTFALTDQNAAAVAEICARLDGLPLAIELAASRLKLFTPNELRDRLRTRLEVLRGGPRELPARQRTLRSTIEWSYDLLDSEERALFKVLSVFSPTRIEAIEAVVGRLESFQEIDAIERLSALVDKSLVRSVEAAGRQQMTMLETIREYAAERLKQEPELEIAATRAHAEYFSDFVDGRVAQLRGPEREITLDELASELGNLLKAWRYWVSAGDLAQLHRLLDGLWVLHEVRGWYYAAVELTNDLLSVLSSVPETAERAREEITLRLVLARGLMAIRGYTDEVEEAYTQALALAEEVGELPQRLPVLRSLASFYLYRGEIKKTATTGRELLELAERQDDVGFQVEAHFVLGSSLAMLGEIQTGLEHMDRAIELFNPQRGSGRLQFGSSPIVPAYTTSALFLWITGYPDRAAARAAHGVEQATNLNHPFSQAYALFHAGFLNLWRRELELVYERATAVLEIALENGYQIWHALAFVLQGTALASLGQPTEGLARTEQGVALYQGMKTPPVFWPLVLYLKATACGPVGRLEAGLSLIDQAIELDPEGFLRPGLVLLKGDLLLAIPDPDGAEFWFRNAFDVAARQGLLMPQLRAATRLTRLWRAAGKEPDGTEQLRGLYQLFTEGFNTLDLVEARALLIKDGS